MNASPQSSISILCYCIQYLIIPSASWASLYVWPEQKKYLVLGKGNVRNEVNEDTSRGVPQRHWGLSVMLLSCAITTLESIDTGTFLYLLAYFEKALFSEYLLALSHSTAKSHSS